MSRLPAWDRESFERQLLAAGYVLARNKKHRVWKGPDGTIFVVPRSTSDHRRAFKNLAATARKRSIPGF